MSSLTPLSGTLRDYAWGKPGGVSAVLGRSLSPAGALEAEYWMATDQILLKVLSAAQTLSLQVHPSAALAAEGFAREEAAGVDRAAPERNYKDLGAKTECLFALSDRFEALVGFRPAVEATAQFALLVDAAGPEALAGAAELFPMLTGDAAVGDAFLWLVSGAARPLVDLLLPAIDAQAVAFPVQAWLHGLYPGDAGVVASILLNHVVLQRGEVLAAPIGTVHAYLFGTGIELMVASDNVLRGGLTPKHVDVAELSRALVRGAAAPMLVAPVVLGAAATEFRVPAVPADLSLVVVTGDASVPLTRPAIVLCTGGSFAVNAGDESATIARGEALLVSGADSVSLTGAGELFLAR